MVKKNQKTQAADTTGAPLKDAVQDSAQLIWQAGLGALNRAQLEGAKAWKALAQEGASLQRKTQAAFVDYHLRHSVINRTRPRKI